MFTDQFRRVFKLLQNQIKSMQAWVSIMQYASVTEGQQWIPNYMQVHQTGGFNAVPLYRESGHSISLWSSLWPPQKDDSDATRRRKKRQQ